MIPQVLTNTSMFIGGVAFAGETPSFTHPKVTIKTEELRAGGMLGPIEMAMGVEKLEASWVNTGVRREALKYFGLADQNACTAVFRGSFKGERGNTVAVIATMRGMLKEVDLGDWKAGEKAEIKYAMAVNYYKLEVGGRLVYEIDMVACVLVVDGVDQMASVRSDLGL